MGKKEATEWAEQLLDYLNLSDRKDHKPSQLSGGEQQRVAVARGLGMETKVLLADEPTGNLDSKNTENLFNILKNLAHEDGYCVVVVTHDEELGKRTDETLRIHDGELMPVHTGAGDQ
jgi:putative ABC transport system ATP-binding protein